MPCVHGADIHHISAKKARELFCLKCETNSIKFAFMDANTIIMALGGVDAAAALCGIKASAVRKWRQNGVPSKHWAIIVRSSDFTFEQLARLDAQEAA